MAANVVTLLDEMLTALRTSHTHFDLSDYSSTPRVVRAEDGMPIAKPPFVAIGNPEPIDVDYEDGAPLTEYRNVGEIMWWGFAPATADTPSARSDAALNLADDVITALQNMHADNTTTEAFTLQQLTFRILGVFGSDPQLPRVGAVHGLIRYQTQRSRGI